MKRSVKQKLLSFTDRLGDTSEIPTFESSFLQIDHSGSVIIKGCVQVNEYSQEKLVLICKTRVIEIIGTKLYISSFSLQETQISGCVAEIRFIKEV